MDFELTKTKTKFISETKLSLQSTHTLAIKTQHNSTSYNTTRMWANAQRDGRPGEHRCRPLFNAAVWLTPTTRVTYSNAAKMPNPLKFAGVPQTNETISAASGPKFTILWGHVE